MRTLNEGVSYEFENRALRRGQSSGRPVLVPAAAVIRVRAGPGTRMPRPQERIARCAETSAS